MTTSAEWAGESIPLFPLASVVLFPRLQIPLYIFEPRYLQMTRAAMAGDGRIGMIAVRPEGVRTMAGDPRVYTIGCAGELESCRERSDGTFDIVLRGTSRFRVIRELDRNSDREYRCAEIELLPDAMTPACAAETERLRTEVMELRDRIVRASESLEQPLLQGLERLDPEILARLDHESLVNVLSALVDFANVEKQSLLEAENVRLRYEMLVSLLQFRLVALDGCGSSDPDLLQ
jgi:Lon protease-like protein